MLMIVGFSIFFIIIDLYIYQAIKVSIHSLSAPWRKGIIIGFWGLTVISIFSVLLINTTTNFFSGDLKRMIVIGIVMLYFSKVFGVLTLLIDDIFRAGQWVFSNFFPQHITEKPAEEGMTRSEFLSKTSLIAVAVPLTTFGIGIASGAHNYRVRRKTIVLPNLPSSFDGIRIGQLSDIHMGSFFSRSGVKKGVELLLGEKPDVVFFTGDIVNDDATEMSKYKDLFSKVKAPLGVYSTLGNHDYGDYKAWNNNDKKKNLADLIQAQKEMGWDILLNENRTLKVDGEEIAIIGIENWGAGRFQKYGDLKKAYTGTEEKPVKLLLSHDPSHWDAQVRPQFSDIDVMFAGHTHGFQFGVEIGDFRWSPSKYIYKQWADLHQEANQFLYVNRGFGFVGYPGRIGILPEITMIELKKA